MNCTSVAVVVVVAVAAAVVAVSTSRQRRSVVVVVVEVLVGTRVKQRELHKEGEPKPTQGQLRSLLADHSLARPRHYCISIACVCVRVVCVCPVYVCVCPCTAASRIAIPTCLLKQKEAPICLAEGTLPAVVV